MLDNEMIGRYPPLNKTDKVIPVEKYTKYQHLTITLCIFTMFIFLIGMRFVAILLDDSYIKPTPTPGMFAGSASAMDILICAGVIFAGVLLYIFIVKMFFSLFCKKKYRSTKNSFLPGSGMPFVACLEVLKPMHFIITYILSSILIHTPTILCYIFFGNATLILANVVFFIMSGHDLLAVFYIMRLKRKYKVKYIRMHCYFYFISMYSHSPAN